MKLTFLGATEEVTGSCFLLEVSHYKILIDCGLIQGSSSEEKRNFEPFPFDASSIDAVFLTHAHIDHSGKLPVLVKAGFKGKIITHHATQDLCRVMLQDAGFLNEKDVELENRKRARRGLPSIHPLYTVSDALKTMDFFHSYAYDERITFCPHIKLTFRDAGHILGSAIIEVWVRDSGVTRKIVFSGDLGRKDMPILKDPSIIHEADLVVMESTYGDRNTPHWQETLNTFTDIIQSAQKSKGNILIPSFAVGRSQEILYTFYEYFDQMNLNKTLIFLDSPMAIEVTKIYAKHWDLYDKAAKNIVKNHGSPYDLPNLRYCIDVADSMAINQIKKGAIIIAGSGMCDGGRIRHHLKHNIWRKSCHLVFVGYQAQGTLGRKILDGDKEINLWGEIIRVKAQIHAVDGFSAHADQQHLLNWYGHFDKLPSIALVHGEKDALSNLSQRLYDKYTIHPWIPTHRSCYDLMAQKPLS